MATRVRFALILLVIYVLCVLLAGAAMAFGTQLPPTNLHMLMPYRSCSLPCLLHIIPGETQRPTALSSLTALADFPIDQSGATWSFQLPDDADNLINGMIVTGDGDMVEFMRLFTRRWAGLGVTLGDLMQDDRMRPTRVYRSCSGSFPVRLLLRFDGVPQVSIAAIIDHHVTPFDPVSLIDVATSDEYFAQTLATLFSNGCYIPSEWQGFASTWRYGSQPVFAP